MPNEIKRLLKDKYKADSERNLKAASELCNNLGEEYRKIGEYDKALLNHEEELNYCEQLKDELDIAVANRKIGECHCEFQNFKKALYHQNIFLTIAVKLKCPIEEQRALATIGRTYFSKFLHECSVGEGKDVQKETLQKSEQLFLSSIKLCETLKPQLSPKDYAQMRSRLLMNIGLVHEHKGNMGQCAENIRHAIFLTKKFKLYEDLHRCQINLASVYQRCEEYNITLKLLDGAISSAKLLQDTSLLCETLAAKANVLVFLKDFQGAKRILKKAYTKKCPVSIDRGNIERNLKVVVHLCLSEHKLQIVKDDIKAQKSLFETMADALSSMQCYKVAIEYYHSTLKCLEKSDATPLEKGEIYVSLAQTYADNKQFEEAIKFFRKELLCNEGNPLEKIKTLLRIADLHKEQNNQVGTEAAVLEAVSQAKLVDDKKYIYMCLKKLNTHYEAIHNDAKMLEVSKDLSKLEPVEDLSTDDGMEFENTEMQFEKIRLSDLSESEDTDIEQEMTDRRTAKRRLKRIENKRNEKGETPLHQACVAGNIDLVKRLVEENHPINTRDNCGWSPLHEACNHGYYEIAEYLLSKGAAINDQGGPLCDGITPLHDAAACGNLDIIELLIDKGASVTTCKNDGSTALEELHAWMKRVDMDNETMEHCKIIETKLISQMKQSGLNSTSTTADEIPDVFHYDTNCSQKLETSISEQSRFSECSLSSSDDEEIYSNPHLQQDKDFNSSHPEQAPIQYQKVMQSLKRKAKHPLQEASNLVKPKQPIPALLDEQNFVCDDWLIKDTVSRSKTKKKRKGGTSKPPNLSRTNHSIQKYLISDSDSRSQSPKTVIDLEEVKPASNNNDSSNVHISKDNFFSVQSLNNKCNALFNLRVHVADKIILVPVLDESFTIEWLTQEAADRYQNLCGNRPYLSLMNKDGALLLPSDVIKTVLKNNEEVMTTINSWDKLALIEHYRQNCVRNSRSVSPSIEMKLSCYESNFALNLSDLRVPDQQFRVLFSSLQYYDCLSQLNLSNIRLIDENLKWFIKCIASFQSLKSLILSCCSLNTNSLKQISNFIQKNGKPTSYFSNLQHLSMSYNVFTPDSSDCFVTFLNLPCIESIDLSSCNITSRFFVNKDFCRCLSSLFKLKIFDISYNELDDIGVAEMLTFLPRNNLRRLDFSYTLTGPITLSQHLLNYTSLILPCLEELHLESCFLKSDDIVELAKCLRSCPKLTYLNISSNPDVSGIALVNLISFAVSSGLALNVLQATGSCNWTNGLLEEFAKSFARKLFTKIEIDCIPQSSEDILFSAWRDAWGHKSICVNEIFCELCIS